MSLDAIIVGVIGIISTVISSWTTHFFTRKRYDAEVEKDIIDNLNQSLDFYIKLSDDNGQRLEKILAINQQLEKEIATLKEQVNQLTEQLRQYQS